MNEDAYPSAYLLRRLLDLLLILVSVVSLVAAVIIGTYSQDTEQRCVIGLGMVASAIGAWLEYRQRTVYESDPVESALLSNALQARYLNTVARLRHKLVAANVLLVVLGIWVSGYGAVWQTP